jgi:A/G-specific adenine glycosylase
VAFQEGKVTDYPVKSKKMKRKVRYFSYCIFEAGDRLLLEKRTGNDIWKNLWQFPVIESVAEIPDHELLSVPYHIISDIHQPVVTDVSPTYQQELTHQSIKARFIRVSLTGFDGINQGRLEVNRKEIHTFAYPVLIRNYLAKMNWSKNNCE